MRYQDPDWVPPSRWSDGVTAGLLDYSLMVNRYMPQRKPLPATASTAPPV